MTEVMCFQGTLIPKKGLWRVVVQWKSGAEVSYFSQSQPHSPRVKVSHSGSGSSKVLSPRSISFRRTHILCLKYRLPRVNLAPRGRRWANQKKFLFLWLTVAFLIFRNSLTSRGTGGDVPWFHKLCLCEEVRSSLQLLLPNIEAPVLIQLLAKDTREVSALSKRLWDLGKYAEK